MKINVIRKIAFLSSIFAGACVFQTAFATKKFAEKIKVTASGDDHETILPKNVMVNKKDNASFIVKAKLQYELSKTVKGTCPAGKWTSSTYKTGPITKACTVEFSATVKFETGGAKPTVPQRWVDASNNIYIADYGNNLIRKVDGSSKIISTVAGIPRIPSLIEEQNTGNGGPATNAKIPGPAYTAKDSLGNLYISVCPYIRKVDTNGVITNFAGNNVEGNYTANYDGGPATAAPVCPYGMALDKNDNLYFGDRESGLVFKIDTKTGIINKVAATSSLASNSTSFSVAIDNSGNLYIVDPNDRVIRKVDAKTQIITTVAGKRRETADVENDGRPATAAALGRPIDIAVDRDGNLFIADAGNHVVRKVDVSTGIITTVAGMFETSGFSGDGGLATAAAIGTPTALAFDQQGNLYISSFGNLIRKVDAVTNIISTVAGNKELGRGFSGDGGPATRAQLDRPFSSWF